MNALLVNKRHLKRGQRRRLATLAKRYGFRRITLPASSTSSARRAESRCSQVKRKHPNSLCTVLARSLVKAERLARSPSVDRVIVRTSKLPSLKTLKATGGSGHANVVFLVAIGRHRSLNKSHWRTAIAQAKYDAGLDLAVSPTGRYRDRALSDYLALLNTGNVAPPPPPPPPGPPPPPPPGTARLWVDTSGGSCTRSATPAAYNDAKACSWNQAYRAAQTGDLILVKGGNYGDVSIGPNRASIGPPGVTFQTAAGGRVVTGDLVNGAYWNNGGGGNNINFVGPATSHTFYNDYTSNITVNGWTVDCGGCDSTQIFHLEESNNIRVMNSDISDNTNDSLVFINGSNLTFENNRIHDAGLGNTGAHTECMYVWQVTNLTLKRNHFYHCSIMDVFITGDAVSNGGYVENNVFEKPWSSTGVISNNLNAFHFRNGGDPSPDPNNWDFRYNTFVGPLSVSPSENPVGSGGMRVIGNVFLSDDPCGEPNTTYAYNAFVTGFGCGTNRITNSLTTYLAGFTSTADPGTYSLKASSVLIDKGNPSSYPSYDLAGKHRFNGAAPDLGAYER